MTGGVQSFIGVDLGWYGKPSGLAALEWRQGKLRLEEVTRIEGTAEIFDWIQSRTGDADAVVAVDAPLVIPNQAGIRVAERELNQQYRRFHAGCHAANLGRPFANYLVSFSQKLCRLGFQHGADMRARQSGRFQIEVHPHAATVSLFDLPLICKYKRGRRADCARELERLRRLMLTRLPRLQPRLQLSGLPELPAQGRLKPAEDQIDAVLCAYIAAHCWYWGQERNSVFGNLKDGYIVVPKKSSS
jgi:predicted RNase H-like nuclease